MIVRDFINVCRRESFSITQTHKQLLLLNSTQHKPTSYVEARPLACTTRQASSLTASYFCRLRATTDGEDEKKYEI